MNIYKAILVIQVVNLVLIVAGLAFMVQIRRNMKKTSDAIRDLRGFQDDRVEYIDGGIRLWPNGKPPLPAAPDSASEKG